MLTQLRDQRDVQCRQRSLICSRRSSPRHGFTTVHFHVRGRTAIAATPPRARLSFARWLARTQWRSIGGGTT